MTCPVNFDHERLKRDSDAWALLHLVGTQPYPAFGSEPAGALELRNCGCGSTLAREVKTAEQGAS